jgi:hypothetical protein
MICVYFSDCSRFIRRTVDGSSADDLLLFAFPRYDSLSVCYFGCRTERGFQSVNAFLVVQVLFATRHSLRCAIKSSLIAPGNSLFRQATISVHSAVGMPFTPESFRSFRNDSGEITAIRASLFWPNGSGHQCPDGTFHRLAIDVRLLMMRGPVRDRHSTARRIGYI